jgi:serine/threonine protein kinase/formylglycine-generating enzyme required for sulfatase activity
VEVAPVPGAFDRDMLFGLLALQNGLVDQDQLLAAFRAWSRDKAIGLAEHLAAHSGLNAEQRAAVAAMVDVHVAKYHGDVGASLAALPAARSTCDQLTGLDDSDLSQTIQRVGSSSIPTEPDGGRTATFTVGNMASDGARFRILRPHAKGGLGAVFVALDMELNREVALKQILDHHADEPTSRARFLLEAEVTGGLEHPGIVPVYGLGILDDGRPYYAMRLIKGESLKEAIERFRKDGALERDQGLRSLELRKLLRRFVDVCNAIEYAHSRGVLHRDIKPANIIVGRHGETLVVDWGLAKAIGRAEPASEVRERTLVPSPSGLAETITGSALGTPAYMSPEQAAGELDRLGPPSDVYSLGATLYCLLTGRPAFAGEVAEILRAVERGDYPRPRKVDQSIDRALEAVCLKAMAPKPEDRYAGARALADDIERWMADEPIAALREPLLPRLARWSRRHRTLTASAAMLLGTASVALLVSTILIGREQNQTRNALRALITAQKERALGRVDALLSANSQALPTLIEEFAPARKWIDPRLRQLLAQDLVPARRRRVRLALLPSDAQQAQALGSELLDCPIDEFMVMAEALRPYRDRLSAELWSSFRDGARPARQRLLAGMALVRFEPDSQRWIGADDEILASQLLNASPDDQRDLRAGMKPIAARMIAALCRAFDDPTAREAIRDAAAHVLAEYARDGPALLGDLISRTSAEQSRLLMPVVLGRPDRRAGAARALEAIAGQAPADDLGETERVSTGVRRARAAIALIQMGKRRTALEAFRESADPEAISQFAQQAKGRGLTPADVIATLACAANAGERFALLLTLGEFRPPDVSPTERSDLLQRVLHWYASDPSAAIHGAAGWLLRAWGLEREAAAVEHTPVAHDPSERRSWFVEAIGDERLTFAVCPPGDFLMGSAARETDRDNDETIHQVTLTRAFGIGVHEVTREQFDRYQVESGGKQMSSAGNPLVPVIGISWFEAVSYCRWLTQRCGLGESDQCYDDPSALAKGPDGFPVDWPFHPDRRGFRLPTEAEWEYACRAGTVTPFSFGSDRALLARFGWFQGNAGRDAQRWGELRPNLFGLFDMHGNAVEWCQDRYTGFESSPARDPIGDPESKYRVYRGGGWAGGARLCRSADRDLGVPQDREYLGFRLAKTLPK